MSNAQKLKTNANTKKKHTQFTWFGNLPTSTGGQQLFIVQREFTERFSQLHSPLFQGAHAFI